MTERGSITILTAVLLGLCGILAVGLSTIGAHLVAVRRAQLAADAAALAAVDQLALGAGCDAARAVAGRLAEDNRARLVEFSCTGASVIAAVRTTGSVARTRRSRAVAEPCVRCGPSVGAWSASTG